MVTSTNREMMERAASQARALVDGAGVLAMAGVSEMPGAGAQMLRALLGHELVASHALMMQLTGKTPQFLALIDSAHTPEQQDRGCRQTVQLTAAIARLIDRYRLGLTGLARLEQQAAEAAHRRAAGPALDPDDDDPEDDGPRGGRRDTDIAKLLAAMAAETRKAARDLDGVAPGAHGTDIGATAPSARRGRLKHGNPSGDFAKAPRCGARTRAGHPCGQPAMANGRCRMHGGCSTGARTAEGLARCRTARLVHGCRTAEIVELKSAAARHGRALRTLTRAANAMARAQSERPTPCQATPLRMVSADTHPLVVTPAKAATGFVDLASLQRELPLPLREGVGGGVSRRQARMTPRIDAVHGIADLVRPNGPETRSRAQTPPPTPSRKGRGSSFTLTTRKMGEPDSGFRRGDNREETRIKELDPRLVRISLTSDPTDARSERSTPCQAIRRRA